MIQKTPDLRSHFGFSTVPFTREIDVHDRFLAPAAEQALADLRRVVESRMSAALEETKAFRWYHTDQATSSLRSARLSLRRWLNNARKPRPQRR